jgi:hypothetical protein
MITDGSYVRMIIAPETRRGTIHIENDGRGVPRFVFQLDPRFAEKLADFIIDEGDIEECERPSDEEITLINRILAMEDDQPGA